MEEGVTVEKEPPGEVEAGGRPGHRAEGRELPGEVRETSDAPGEQARVTRQVSDFSL